jgi:hypothetical protein
MAKKVKSSKHKRPAKGRAKKDLEFLVSLYQNAMQKADDALRPQAHPIARGQVLDTRRVLENAHFLMSAAIERSDYDLEGAFDYFNIARGMAMVHGIVPDEVVLIPESTFTYTPEKSS